MQVRNALSIDLEDWYHPEFVRKYIHYNAKPQITDSTKRIIELLEKYKVQATFFVLGAVAKKHPDLIELIYDKGHEIASHGMEHLPLESSNFHKFNKDLILFKKTIFQILGDRIKIYGFRAPTFSINNSTNYVLKCLIKNDYFYDSSIVPTRFFYYGLKNSPREIYRPNLSDLVSIDKNSRIIEFPMTVIDIGKICIPISGGFILRFFPYFIYRTLLKKINQMMKPFVIYFHPWETYPKTYRVKNIGILKYTITYFGIKSALNKIEKLIKDFKFGTVKEIIDERLH